MNLFSCLTSECLLLQNGTGMYIVQVFFSAFFAILFLQSGIDKITDRRGNLKWLTGHFSNSPFASFVPILLTTLTMFELAAGSFSLLAVPFLLIYKSFCLAYFGTILSAISFLMLFLGQRLAKDYGGAATIALYFLIAAVDLCFLALLQVHLQ